MAASVPDVELLGQILSHAHGRSGNHFSRAHHKPGNKPMATIAGVLTGTVPNGKATGITGSVGRRDHPA